MPNGFAIYNTGAMSWVGRSYGLGDLAETTDYWDHNREWSMKHRDRCALAAEGLKKNIDLAVGNTMIDPKEVGGTGNALGVDFPEIRDAAKVALVGYNNWMKRRSQLETIRLAAVLWHDGNAMYLLKEEYRGLADDMEKNAAYMRDALLSAIDARSKKITAEWKSGWWQAKQSVIATLKKPITWAKFASTKVITVVKEGGEKVVTIVGEKAKEATGSILGSPTFWLLAAVAAAAYFGTRQSAPASTGGPTAGIEFSARDLAACKRAHPRWSRNKCMSYLVAQGI